MGAKLTAVKRILCLANSRKPQGRCIAGLELDGARARGWIRPVSSRPHQAVAESERRYEDGSEPQVLDVIDIPLISPQPRGHQQENWVLDHNFYWAKVGELAPRQLTVLADASGSLWKNGWQTRNGLNDCIPTEETDVAGGSLKLILLKDGLKLRVYTTGGSFGNPKRRVQADFHFDGVRYNIWVTDPVIEDEYQPRPDGEYELGASYLTVSLGEPYVDERCHKLVAAIIGA
ncbi:dual OB domain-containing protein [Micromonospora wenchangensis]|uniref:dual OB domain-containing protein n=1 Tax=Micromonospora wenchangensis TaxID=1185415 RepID=UPI0038129EB5